MREWKLLFTSGQPLYEEEDRKSIELSPEQILEEERQKLLNEGDFMEYKVFFYNHFYSHKYCESNRFFPQIAC